MAQYRLPSRRPSSRRAGRITLVIAAILILLGGRTIASTVIDYEWWKEMGQVNTWLNMYLYGFGPLASATLVAFLVLWLAHALGMKFAETELVEHPTYAELSVLVLLLTVFVISTAALHTCAVIAYFGSRR